MSRATHVPGQRGTWRDGGCVSTTRLSPDEAARLISVLADGLAAAAGDGMIEAATTG